MTSNPDNDLAKTWARYDFRESFFAPGLAILQALTVSGKTASGTGDTRDDALERCLSETAELLALDANRQHAPSAPTFDGIAAHTDAEAARRAALWEAHERAAVMAWWRGAHAARPLPHTWMAQSGLLSWLNSARAGATSRRVTRLWSLDGCGPLQVAISRSTNDAGQDPILGFGAADTLEKAGAKALRETLEMELNLVEVMAVRGGHLDFDVGWIEEKIDLYATVGRPRLPDEGDDAPPAAVTPQRDLNAQITDLTQPGQRPVWACRLDGGPILQPHETTPFMSKTK